jgi:hypothetical protein
MKRHPSHVAAGRRQVCKSCKFKELTGLIATRASPLHRLMNNLAWDFSLSNSPSRVAIASAVQPANATSAVHLTLCRIEAVVEKIEHRLAKVETAQRSLRRRQMSRA